MVDCVLPSFGSTEKIIDSILLLNREDTCFVMLWASYKLEII